MNRPRFDLPAERERIQPDDLGEFLAARGPLCERLGGKAGLMALLQRVDARTKTLTGPKSQPLRYLLGQLTDAECQLPEGTLSVGLVKGRDTRKCLPCGPGK